MAGKNMLRRKMLRDMRKSKRDICRLGPGIDLYQPAVFGESYSVRMNLYFLAEHMRTFGLAVESQFDKLPPR